MISITMQRKSILFDSLGLVDYPGRFDPSIAQMQVKFLGKIFGEWQKHSLH